MFWPHTKTPIVFKKHLCLRYLLFCLRQQTRECKQLQTKRPIITFTLITFYILFCPGQVLRLDATSFLQKPKNKLLIEMSKKFDYKTLSPYSDPVPCLIRNNSYLSRNYKYFIRQRENKTLILLNILNCLYCRQEKKRILEGNYAGLFR